MASLAQKTYNQFYEVEKLLSKELIKNVAKDAEGYLWIATDAGVLRFDGSETRLFYKELPSPYTKAFLKTAEGKFYVLHDYGIKEIVKGNDSIYFKPLTAWGKVFDDPLEYPKSIYEDSRGNIWIGEFNAVVKIGKEGLRRFELGEAYRSINYHRTFSFAEDAFGNLWIAPFKGRLLSYDENSGELREVDIDFPLTEVSGLVNVKGDYLVTGGHEGLFKIKVDSDKRILDSEFIPDIKDISTLISFNNTEIFIGTWTSGLYHADFESNNPQYKKVENVAFNDIIDFHYDKKNQELWVAGSENIGLFKHSLISVAHQAGENRIESLAFDDKNNIYYSIGKQIFKINDYKYDEPELILSADETYYDRILIDGNKLWIGDSFGRISYLDMKKNRMVKLLEDIDVAIQFAYRDEKGNKWFAGHSRGLIKVRKDETIRFYENVGSSVVIKESSGGKIYCGNNGGPAWLFSYHAEKDEFTPVHLAADFEISEKLIVNDMQFDASDNLWIATDHGILFSKNENGEYNTVTRITVSGFDENEPVRAIAIAKDFICLANSFGLVIYKNGEALLFGQEAGLPSKILKERGLIFDREGNLLIATAKGIALFGKEDVDFSQTSPPIFKSVMVNGKNLKPATNQVFQFPYKTRIEAEFIALSFPGSGLEYQTRIVGLDDRWTSPSGNRNISVIGFSEGDYILQVRTKEMGKLWSEPLSFPFSIAKPWFRTWWALLGFVVLATFIIWISIKIHNYNLIRQKQNLRKIIEERTAEINRQKNEIIEQQDKIIQQKEELLEKNNAVYKSQQALIEADMNFLHLKEKQLQDQIEYKNKQITTHTLNIIQKNESLKELRNKLEDIVKHPDKSSVVEVRKTLKIIDESFRLDKDWEDFKLYFEQIYTGFYAKLKINYPELTNQELRHCALIRLNLTNAECASILGISPDSIKVSRTRLRKKLNMEHHQNLTDFIMGI